MPLECYYCHKPLYSIHEKHTETDCRAWLELKEQERKVRQAEKRRNHSPALPDRDKSDKTSRE